MEIDLSKLYFLVYSYTAQIYVYEFTKLLLFLSLPVGCIGDLQIIFPKVYAVPRKGSPPPGDLFVHFQLIHII
jgi:hypothetical protein